MQWFKIAQIQVYDKWYKGRIPCAVIPIRNEDAILVEFQNGEQIKAYRSQVKDKPNPKIISMKDMPYGMICRNCGKPSVPRSVCEHCGEEPGEYWP